MLPGRISNKRTLESWPVSANAFHLSLVRLPVSDLRQIENDVERLPVDLSWQQLRLER